MAALITPVNVSVVTKAVEQMLNDDPSVGGQGALIERSAPLREEATSDGWVGIYRSQVKHVARALGMSAAQRMSRVLLMLVVRESAQSSGADCEDNLEDLVQRVLQTLLSDPSLKGTVQMLDEVVVNYDRYEKDSDDVFNQSATLFITALAPTGVAYT